MCTGKTMVLPTAQSFSRSYRSSINKEIPRILWYPKVHYRIHNSPPPALIPSQLDPTHAPTPHFLKIRFNIIIPSTPGSYKCSFSQVSPPKPCIYLSSLYMLHASPMVLSVTCQTTRVSSTHIIYEYIQTYERHLFCSRMPLATRLAVSAT